MTLRLRVSVLAACALFVAGCSGGDYIPLADVAPPKDKPTPIKNHARMPSAKMRSPDQPPTVYR